jgi:GntR family transcriptional regulator
MSAPAPQTAPQTAPDSVLARILAGYARTGGTEGPVYLRLASTLRGLIELRELKGGDALPSERDLSQAAGLSRVTVRKALDVLGQEGLVERRQGAGSFVTRQIEQPASVLIGFTDDMRRRGAVAASRLIRKAVGLPDPSEMLKLGLSPADRVLRLSRVRLSDGEPLAIEHAVVPAGALPSPTIGESLYEALKAGGNMPVRALQRVQAGVATPAEADLLEVAPGSPVLRIERRSFLANGRPIEVTVSAYRGDRYDFVAELSLDA